MSFSNAMTPGAPSFELGGFHYFAFRTSGLFGLAVPAGAFDDVAGEVLPSSFVPPRTVGELRRMAVSDIDVRTVATWRRGKIDDSTITSFRTLRDAEGAKVAELLTGTFGALGRQMLDELGADVHHDQRMNTLTARMARGFSFTLALFIHACARNGLAEHVAFALVTKSLQQAWEAMYPEAGRLPLVFGRTFYVDVRGKEHDAPHSGGRVLTSGVDGSKSEEPALDEYGDVMTKKVYPAIPWKRPALPFTREHFSKLFAEAVVGGSRALVGKDEHLNANPPDDAYRAEHARRLHIDPWRQTLVRLVRSRPDWILRCEFRGLRRLLDVIRDIEHRHDYSPFDVSTFSIEDGDSKRTWFTRCAVSVARCAPAGNMWVGVTSGGQAAYSLDGGTTWENAGYSLGGGGQGAFAAGGQVILLATVKAALSVRTGEPGLGNLT